MKSAQILKITRVQLFLMKLNLGKKSYNYNFKFDLEIVMASSDILVFFFWSKRKAAHFSSVSQKKIFQFFVDFSLVFWRQKSTIYFFLLSLPLLCGGKEKPETMTMCPPENRFHLFQRRLSDTLTWNVKSDLLSPFPHPPNVIISYLNLKSLADFK